MILRHIYVYTLYRPAAILYMRVILYTFVENRPLPAGPEDPEGRRGITVIVEHIACD